jgi:molybdate transport system substrate-binding protein
MSADIRLFAAVAVRPAIMAVVPRFEAAIGWTVTPSFDLNPAVKHRIGAGEAFDVVIINPHMVAELAAAGRVAAASQLSFGRIAMGMAARAGSPVPDIASVAALAAALKRAASIAYASEGSSGAYFLGLLERLGIAAEVKPRLVPIAGSQTAASVARGQAELAVVPVTSILAAAPDVTLVGQFPAELQSYIDFAIGIGSKAQDPEAAGRLAAFLASQDIDDVLMATGVERR